MNSFDEFTIRNLFKTSMPRTRDFHEFTFANSEIFRKVSTQGGGHFIVKNTGGWLDSLGSGILVGKDILGFYKNIDLDNS